MTDPTGVHVGLVDAATDADIEAFAPGRVNLIGEHTDYTGGLALPMAVQLGTTVRGLRGGRDISLVSDAAEGVVNLDVEALNVGATDPPWGRHIAAVAGALLRRRPVGGFTGTISTTLPVGAGLSSSAALDVSLALGLGFAGTAGELATVAQEAEQAATGVPCGLMDQLASTCGVAGHALRIDFSTATSSTATVTPIPLPDDVEVVVAHSGRSRTLAGSAYADRRQQCAAAATLIGPLADARPADTTAISDPVLRRRARHVTSENERVDAFIDALGAADPALAGQILVASHRSLADDFEVSVPELDELVERLVATPGVYGARLTGAGFGGCVVALTAPGVLAAAPGVWPVQAASGAWVRLVTT